MSVWTATRLWRTVTQWQTTTSLFPIVVLHVPFDYQNRIAFHGVALETYSEDTVTDWVMKETRQRHSSDQLSVVDDDNDAGTTPAAVPDNLKCACCLEWFAVWFHCRRWHKLVPQTFSIKLRLSKPRIYKEISHEWTRFIGKTCLLKFQQILV